MLLERSLKIASVAARNPHKALIDIDRGEARESLAEFIKMAWHVLEPSREYVHGWHIDAICEHLEAVTRGDITRLLINVPPGAMKSLSTNVFWPAWEWGPMGMAANRYVCASYSDRLTIRDNRKCRNLISSPWYRARWGSKFQLVSDQNEKVKFENNRTGFKLATSVGGLGTGERGDRFVIDDPHNVKKGESQADRQEKRLWFKETVPTRVNDPEKSAIVVIMQRVHEDDISGVILSDDYGYEHLMIPMEFEPDRKCYTNIGWKDPRTKKDELITQYFNMFERYSNISLLVLFCRYARSLDNDSIEDISDFFLDEMSEYSPIREFFGGVEDEKELREAFNETSTD